jgi:hypothetical protein
MRRKPISGTCSKLLNARYTNQKHVILHKDQISSEIKERPLLW